MVDELILRRARLLLLPILWLLARANPLAVYEQLWLSWRFIIMLLLLLLLIMLVAMKVLKQVMKMMGCPRLLLQALGCDSLLSAI